MKSDRSLTLAWTMALVAVASALVVSFSRAHRAGTQARVQLVIFNQVAGETRELARLRSASPVDHQVTSESAQLAPAVTATLAACGLPASIISSLSPQSESFEIIDKHTRLTRKLATLVVAPMTLPQLGRFLQVWREVSPSAGPAPVWSVVRLELDPRQMSASGGPPPGSDLPLRIVIGLESVSLAAPSD